MSANLLNSTALTGAGPGAGVGIAAQAAHAAQANGPLAGFEAMLAAFFGDQGLIAPGTGSPALAGPGVGQAIAGQASGGQASGGKASGKSAAAGKDAATSAEADKTTANATALDATANGVDAALTLIVPAQPTVPQPNANAVTATASDTPDTGADGKAHGSGAIAALTAVIDAKAAKNPDAPSLATLTAVLDAKTAKAAGVLAQDTSAASAAAPGQSAKIEASATEQANVAQPTPPAPGPAETATDALPAALSAASVTSAQAKPAEAAAGKDRAPAAKGERVEGARTDTPQIAAAGKSALAIPAFADGAGKDASSDGRNPTAPTAEAKPAAVDATQGGDFNLATNSAGGLNNPAALAHAAALVRGGAQTVANLAAQIVKKLDGRSSRFDVQLDPAGLGKVNVRVEIDATGKMTAAMNFDNQQAANDLKSRAGELQRALEQAGFDMSGGLSFDVGQGGQGRSQGQDAEAAPTFRGRAFQAVLDGGADAPSLSQSSFGRAARSGVDIRI